MENVEFKEFAKIPRLSREIVVTEKIDGTNGVVYISETGKVIAGSRNRWITPDKDNFGFAKWVEENKEELKKLGAGYHYGEWWGLGIQRGYSAPDKRWSLFNQKKWSDETVRPKCCLITPLLYTGIFDTFLIEGILQTLKEKGSRAFPRFMKPEGIVIYHTAGNLMFKKTIEKDDEHKGQQK